MDVSGISTDISKNIPEKIFVVPYRDRKQHKAIFLHYMKYILEDENYEIYFVEQNDKRHFNRGALKNIGFMQGKENYPNHYRNITFIFHDIDLIPYKKGLFSYKANIKEAYHYYGFDFLLGGIVAMKGEDIERINGFPNYWAWGWEDNAIASRFQKILKGKVNRSEFLKINHPDVLSFYHGFDKTTSPTNQAQYQKEYEDLLIYSGIHSIKNLKKFEQRKDNIHDIRVDYFLTEFPEEKYVYQKETTWQLGERLRKEARIRNRNNRNNNNRNNNNTNNTNNKTGPLMGGFNIYGKYNMIMK